MELIKRHTSQNTIRDGRILTGKLSTATLGEKAKAFFCIGKTQSTIRRGESTGGPGLFHFNKWPVWLSPPVAKGSYHFVFFACLSEQVNYPRLPQGMRNPGGPRPG